MLRKTALHDSHVALGAKMGAFAGYDMPLFYPDGVMKEHEWTRSHAGIFDVSHMGQAIIEGTGVVEFLEKITPSPFQAKKNGRAQYTVLTNEDGGIVDDLIITRLEEKKFFIVFNAGCKEKDIAWIKKNLPITVHLHPLADQSLIALQGRWAERIVFEIFEYDAKDLGYMCLAEIAAPDGTPCYLSRLGYTGEDGFEISVPDDIAPDIWDRLIRHSEARPIGLAARDSLRLEMGYPLYGHDIDDTTSPVEAGLQWIIGKSNTGFIGAARVLNEMKNGTARQRVGLKLLDPGVAREGAEIRSAQDQVIGKLTSGGFSPSLKQSIGMGYVESSAAKTGQRLFVHVRGKNLQAEIVDLPFMQPKTKSMKKAA